VTLWVCGQALAGLTKLETKGHRVKKAKLSLCSVKQYTTKMNGRPKYVKDLKVFLIPGVSLATEPDISG